MRSRVLITGIGTVSAAGLDAKKFSAALRRGRRCFSALNDPRLHELRATHAGLIGELRPAANNPPAIKDLDRNMQLALAAAQEALQHSGLDGAPLGPRAAVVLGTCSGGMLSIEKHYQSLSRGKDLLDEELLFCKRYHSAARVLAWAAGASGPTVTVVTACAAGSGAVAQAADLIRSGLADLALAGGSDSFAPSTLAGFDALKATCAGMCSPFAEANVGLNLGEGAGFFVLESQDHAAARKATWLAELIGLGLSNDAYHPTAPDPSGRGQLAAMQSALNDAGADPAQIDYVNAHGTGTRSNDPTESRSVGRLLGDHAQQVPVSSTKSMIGHCLGGAGALEAAATILSAREGFLLPTAGFDRPRDGCHLPDFVPDPGRPWQGRIALNNSFGFGGHNACLLLDLDPSPERPLTDLREPRRSAVGITGYGVVSPLGLGPEPLADTDRTGVAPIKRFAVPVEPFPAGLVPRIDSREVDRRLDLKGFDLCSSYATLAARTCLAHAGIHPRPQITAQIGLVLGLAAGPSQGEAEHLGAVFNHGFALSSLGAFPYVVPNEVAGNTSRALLLKGHSTVLAAGPGAGLAALISAAIAVDQGHAHQVIALAADELSERTAADGYKVGNWGPGTEVIPGEGAAALLLEQQSSARARSAPILAEVLGSAMATDATSPRGTSGPDALGRAASQALAQAQVRPDQVSHFTLGGHGAATDALAIQALTSLIGDLPPPELQLAERLGFAEASLSLFELIAVLYSAEEGSITLAGFLSAEGLASALVLRTTAGVPD